MFDNYRMDFIQEIIERLTFESVKYAGMSYEDKIKNCFKDCKIEMIKTVQKHIKSFGKKYSLEVAQLFKRFDECRVLDFDFTGEMYDRNLYHDINLYSDYCHLFGSVGELNELTMTLHGIARDYRQLAEFMKCVHYGYECYVPHEKLSYFKD